ncbi:aspartate ammonia-lyase [Agrobacterium rhizogenes]|uniref:aspartate ammonia-lyase n=1 Tax=Rhizobium rhizogenes TaxID=359 RepID=UPI0015718E65|nr:aspartate ammonia-lyase [Rhizobium rhizogenes]NTF51829.1 aspartate ammonia-lyase [Rhizobium rhizogenes]NTG17372.1 aspartate ammonia-lyase [Rhizobium rhizogenes]NTG24033.1 aspartate ammonia-lyase [Rhizobium rhizogenes]NTG30976.1 aspartate ammonia-lyase [Rhizobium rhizogenes]NTG37785.1 aspartate ammonia-lyase [Rhizobium rhizogenes]
MTRREHDLLGTKEIPADVYWGVHTARAVENFQVTGMTIGRNPYLVRGLTFVKEAAAIANHELGLLDQVRMDAIVRACREIRAGALHDQFVLDEIQGGAGTSTNMNANEVIANRALELLGHSKGDYAHLHPNDHVNLSQSTNDAYPTAINIALIEAIDDLAASMTILKTAFDRKAQEFARLIKMGRTQLQDAVPMTLGQEFRTFVVMLGEDKARLLESAALLHEINLGATAIGTGLNAPRGYAALACEHLSRLTGRPLVTAEDLIEATQDPGAFVHLSGVLKRVAVKLSKTCNDLRLLSSGPRAGIGEITLPAVQAGSSIMPGKINPVIPEMVNQVAYAVIGNDITITMAAEAGQLQLNAFEPIMVRALSQSISQLSAACRILAERCVDGIQANPAIMAARVEESIGLATALNPLIGYYAATEVAQEALASGRTVPEVVLERGHLTVEQLQKALSPEHLANLPSIVIAEPDLLQ